MNLKVNLTIRTILRDLGLFVHVPGVMALIALPVCLAWGETYAIPPFTLCALASLLTGQILSRFRRANVSSSIAHAMLTAALGWIILPSIAAMPILAIARILATVPGTSTTVLQFTNPGNAFLNRWQGLPVLDCRWHYTTMNCLTVFNGGDRSCSGWEVWG